MATQREQHEHNWHVIRRVAAMVEPDKGLNAAPSYREAVAALNAEGWRTSCGRPWTRRALYRMLQREDVALCLLGIIETVQEGTFTAPVTEGTPDTQPFHDNKQYRETGIPPPDKKGIS